MKLKTKTFIGRVVIKKTKKGGKPLPDFGLGKGVLSEQEITFKDERGRGFDSPTFSMALWEHAERMVGDVVHVQWTEKKPSRKNG
jgi:hypothetical protein